MHAEHSVTCVCFMCQSARALPVDISAYNDTLWPPPSDLWRDYFRAHPQTVGRCPVHLHNVTFHPKGPADVALVKAARGEDAAKGTMAAATGRITQLSGAAKHGDGVG